MTINNYQVNSMKSKLKFLIILILVFIVNFSCTIYPNIGQEVDHFKSTVESAATDINHNQLWIQTARAIATEIGDSSYLETAQAIATNIGETDLLKTAQILITNEPPRLLDTLQSMTTEQSPSIIKTAQAIATKGLSQSGEVPDDIPIVEGNKKNYYISSTNISYTTSLSYNEVKYFYQNEMNNKGWKKIDGKSIEIGMALINVFEKNDRVATLSISQNMNAQTTLVLINIQPDN